MQNAIENKDWYYGHIIFAHIIYAHIMGYSGVFSSLAITQQNVQNVFTFLIAIAQEIKKIGNARTVKDFVKIVIAGIFLI